MRTVHALGLELGPREEACGGSTVPERLKTGALGAILYDMETSEGKAGGPVKKKGASSRHDGGDVAWDIRDVECEV